jgi:hypothetical protein
MLSGMFLTEIEKMSGVIAYFLILGVATAVALTLFFGLKAAKLI